jgi:hypothetical protein
MPAGGGLLERSESSTAEGSRSSWMISVSNHATLN